MFNRGVGLLVLALLFTVLATVAGASQHVIISEVAWAGTQAGSADEWIELYNASDAPIDLSGWTLAIGDRDVMLGDAADPVLPAGEFFLLERTDDEAVADVPADLIYTGTLSNTGTVLRLLDADGNEVDSANAGSEAGWAGGAARSDTPAYGSMERVDPSGPDTPSNWGTNDGLHRAGSDAKGNPINGTPRARNSATLVWRTTPAVHLISAIEEGAVVTGTLSLSWTASDPDGPATALHATVLLSADDGVTWEPLIEGLVGTSYAWDTAAALAGDAYQLRIAVTDADGNTGVATSPTFEVGTGS